MKNIDTSLQVICANLSRRSDRRFVMYYGVQSVCGVPMNFFSAVDGESIPKGRLTRYADKTTPESYAVRLTKRLALRHFLQGEASHLLYLEDDVVVTEEIDDTVQEAMLTGHNIVFLGGSHQVAPEGEGRWKRCVATFDNHALLLTRKGAKQILSLLGLWWRRSYSDREIQLAMEEGRLEAWCVDPWVAYQRHSNSDNFGNRGSYSLAEIAHPFMMPDDLAVLDTALNFSRTVIEFGSGASTLHLGSRLAGWGSLLSIEHNPIWYDKVEKQLLEHDFPVKLILCGQTNFRGDEGPSWGSRKSFEDYIQAPHRYFREGQVDLIFVDGRRRIDCAIESAPLLKEGGLILIHEFWSKLRYSSRINELLPHYNYLFTSPIAANAQYPQGLAVFQRK